VRGPLILILLLAGMHLIMPLGARGLGSEALLVFGFLILAAYTVGDLAARVHLPKIVGYMLAGALFGPYALGTFTTLTAQRLEPVSHLAIALIAFLAGAELRWSELRERGVALLKILTAELLLTFVALAAALYVLRDLAPFLTDLPTGSVVAFSVLFASIAVAHSPAATIALLGETRARGDVARTTLGVVLISDVAVVVLFSIALSVARAVAPASGEHAVSTFMLIWELAGSLIIGTLLGSAVALYLRFVSRELMLFAVLMTFFGAEIAALAHTDPLLTLIVAGFVTENAPIHRDGEKLRHAMERAAAPVFVVFFALSGAAINLGQAASLALITVPLAIVRLVSIRAGTAIGMRWARLEGPYIQLTWLGLVSQAGVAIGLSNMVASAYPRVGNDLRTLLFALIAINQIIGPVLFRRALVMSGEVSGERFRHLAIPDPSPVTEKTAS
jgi:Kef-type K+ transport system membrane component KefB